MVVVAAVSRTPNPNVIREARGLADAFGEELHVVNVLEGGEFLEIETEAVEETGRPESMADIRERARQHAADHAGEFTAVGLVGKPSTEVIDYADERDASYVVVGGRKRSPAGKALFGSTTQSILLNANRPVLTVLERE